MQRALVLAAALAAIGAATPAAAAGAVPWCGNDRLSTDRPDALGGRKVHVIYAIPSDGEDRFATVASQITTGVGAVAAWWAREDPASVPRFDRFPFPACASAIGGLDLSFARLPNPVRRPPARPRPRRLLRALGHVVGREDSLWLARAAAPDRRLTVELAGALGGEAVTSGLPGIDCPAVCEVVWAGGDAVELTAAVGARTRFLRWEGDCAGRGDCTVTIDADRRVRAVFGPASHRVRLTVTGRGAIASADAAASGGGARCRSTPAPASPSVPAPTAAGGLPAGPARARRRGAVRAAPCGRRGRSRSAPSSAARSDNAPARQGPRGRPRHCRGALTTSHARARPGARRASVRER